MFDKSRCIENIYSLAKQKNLKIGDLEEKAGVSKGYLSRLNKADSTANPPIDFLVSVAEQLGVSVDFLISFSDANLNENEVMVVKFIERLKQETLTGGIDWVVQANDILTADNGDSVDNPLIEVVTAYTNDFCSEITTHKYTSLFRNDGFCVIGDGYYCYLPEIDAKIYLVKVRYHDFVEAKEPSTSHQKDDLDVIEVYLYSGNEPGHICSTGYVKPEISAYVDELYEMIGERASRMILLPIVKSKLESFLNS